MQSRCVNAELALISLLIFVHYTKVELVGLLVWQSRLFITPTREEACVAAAPVARDVAALNGELAEIVHMRRIFACWYDTIGSAVKGCLAYYWDTMYGYWQLTTGANIADIDFAWFQRVPPLSLLSPKGRIRPRMLPRFRCHAAGALSLVTEIA